MSKQDSTGKRLVKGTGVTWIRLAITIVAQLVTTPLYLQFWSVETYGTWLLLVAAIGFLQIPGASFQNYIGFELMREAAQDKSRFTILLRSSLWLGAIYGLVELSIAVILAFTVIPNVTGMDSTAMVRKESSIVFIIMALGSGLNWNWGGIWVRGASATGHYARGAWWGVADGMFKVLSPLIVIPLGFGMTGAALTLALSLLLLHQFTLWDLRRLVRLDMADEKRVDLRLAWTCFRESQGLSLKAGLEMLRQQGIRLVLGPVMGATQLAAFASMRTGANAALQGLSSITNPLMPELMRFLSKRDQARSEAAMGTVWMIVIGLMAPAFVILQVFMETLFHWWTRGKIPYDAPFFATVSTGVLVYAAAQPAVAIVRGNNLVKVQFVNSLVAGIIAVTGTLVLGKMMGLLGVGIALLLAELASSLGFRISARRWLNQNQMIWPKKASDIVVIGVWLSAICMALIAFMPGWKIWVLVCFILAISTLVIHYFRSLPEMVTSRIKSLGEKLPITRHILKHI